MARSWWWSDRRRHSSRPPTNNLKDATCDRQCALRWVRHWLNTYVGIASSVRLAHSTQVNEPSHSRFALHALFASDWVSYTHPYFLTLPLFRIAFPRCDCWTQANFSGNRYLLTCSIFDAIVCFLTAPPLLRVHPLSEMCMRCGQRNACICLATRQPRAASLRARPVDRCVCSCTTTPETRTVRVRRSHHRYHRGQATAEASKSNRSTENKSPMRLLQQQLLRATVDHAVSHFLHEGCTTSTRQTASQKSVRKSCVAIRRPGRPTCLVPGLSK